MQSTPVKLPGGRDVAINKLSLRKLAQILASLKSIPGHLQNIDKLGTDEVIAKLPVIIADSMDELAKILCICCDLTEEQVLDELSLVETTALVKEILTVNQFDEVVANLKGISALANKKPQVGPAT